MPSIQRSSGGGSSSGRSTSKTAIVPGAMKVFNQLLGLNEQNYGNLLTGYSQGMQNMQAQLPGIYGSYDTGKQEVLGMLGVTGGGFGVATPAAAAIQQKAASDFGASQQQLINSGMGSGTVLAGVRTANQLAAGQAMAGLGANLAQTAAGYASQFDLAKSGAEMQGLGMETNFTGQYMGDLSHYQFNTMGVPLTGQFSQSQQQGVNQYSGSGQSVESFPGRGGGMGGGGGYGPGMQTNPAGGGGPYGLGFQDQFGALGGAGDLQAQQHAAALNTVNNIAAQGGFIPQTDQPYPYGVGNFDNPSLGPGVVAPGFGYGAGG